MFRRLLARLFCCRLCWVLGSFRALSCGLLVWLFAQLACPDERLLVIRGRAGEVGQVDGTAVLRARWSWPVPQHRSGMGIRLRVQAIRFADSSRGEP